MPLPQETIRVSFAILWNFFPGRPPGIAVEIPTARSVVSLESISELLGRFRDGIPSFALAYVQVEIARHHLSERAAQCFADNERSVPEQLANLLRGPLTALMEKFIATPPDQLPIEERVAETLELQIFDVHEHVDTVPGTYVEVSNGHDVRADLDYWEQFQRTDRPDENFGHLTIEYYPYHIQPDMQVLIDHYQRGEPGALEEAIRDTAVGIFRSLKT